MLLVLAGRWCSKESFTMEIFGLYLVLFFILIYPFTPTCIQYKMDGIIDQYGTRAFTWLNLSLNCFEM